MNTPEHPGASAAVTAPSAPSALPGAGRAVWLKNLHRWHWISSALCLMAIFLFTITGFTLNHAAQIEARPRVTRQKAALPPALAKQLQTYGAAHPDSKGPLTPQLAAWAEQTFPVDVSGKTAEWTGDDAYVALPRPGGDAWLRIGADGAEYEKTDRGAISWLNDMHKGRNAGVVWSWFIDLFALACLVFCITGFLILKFHAANRPSTWPVIGFGIVLPVVLALLYVH